jgi:hypothetical protein
MLHSIIRIIVDTNGCRKMILGTGEGILGGKWRKGRVHAALAIN